MSDRIVHNLKTDPAAFQAVLDGRKKYELRFDDRSYRVGHVLHLVETRYAGQEMRAGAPVEFTGRECRVRVTHLLRGPIYGLAAGWVILSVEPCATPAGAP